MFIGLTIDKLCQSVGSNYDFVDTFVHAHLHSIADTNRFVDSIVLAICIWLIRCTDSYNTIVSCRTYVAIFAHVNVSEKNYRPIMHPAEFITYLLFGGVGIRDVSTD